MCLANVDDIEQSWFSPNGDFIIHHTAAYNSRLVDWRRAENIYEQKAAYTLTNNGSLLWAAESAVDESAHDFHCVWSPDSKWALILDRPARGEVQILLISTATPKDSKSLHLQRIIVQVEAKAGDFDDRHLQKAWFGEWKATNGKFEGIVMVAKERYHRVHLILDPSEKIPNLRLRDVKTSKMWNGDLEKL